MFDDVDAVLRCFRKLNTINNAANSREYQMKMDKKRNYSINESPLRCLHNHLAGLNPVNWLWFHSMTIASIAVKTYHFVHGVKRFVPVAFVAVTKRNQNKTRINFKEFKNSLDLRMLSTSCFDWWCCCCCCNWWICWWPGWWSLHSFCWNDSLKYCRTWFFCFCITW